MQRLDQMPIPEHADEIRVFAVMRNELLRLTSWLCHYRMLGVDRFFVVDNGSTDGTLEELLKQPDVHVFSTLEDFQQGQSGSLWIEQLMRRFGVSKWCVVADADELLAFPGWEKIGLKTLVNDLSAAGDEALPCVLLDMYSDLPVAHTHPQAGANLFELCPWFDPDIEEIEGSVGDSERRVRIPTLVGGMRRRVFGVDAYLSKIGLLHYAQGMTLTRGQHGVVGAKISAIRGVMFHFKFLSDMIEKARMVIENGERANCAPEWLAYHEAFTRSPGMTLHAPRSIRMLGSGQLLRLGLMRSHTSFQLPIHATLSNWSHGCCLCDDRG